MIPHPAETRAHPIVCCVIPCYNVAAFCGEVVRETATYADYVIAVNDGSSDDTEKVLRYAAAEHDGRVCVLSFVCNRGKGAALLAGFRYALAQRPFDVLVTLDGDRQHRPADISRLVEVWRTERATMIIGERCQFEAMPLRSRFGNTLISMLLRRLYPTSPCDTQSGFRAISRSFVEEVMQTLKDGRYETELSILMLALRQQRRVCTVPIPTVYLDGNRSSHFHPLVDSLRVSWALLAQVLIR
jgi:glycosyltransferase involved in cell wall biosynthesis